MRTAERIAPACAVHGEFDMDFRSLIQRGVSAFFGASLIALCALLAACTNCPALACSPAITLNVSEELAALGPIEILIDGERIECNSEHCSMHVKSDGGVTYWIDRRAERVEVFVFGEDDEPLRGFSVIPRYRESEAEVYPDCDERCPDNATIVLP